VEIKALNAEGKPIAFRCGGLLARAVQHEVDHLNGVLFIDRMPPETKAEFRAEIDDLHTATKKTLVKKKK
jgi:peptide deformylase